MAHLRSKASTLALLAALLGGCGPGPEHYVAVLDELTIPPTWELVYVTVSSPGGEDVTANPGVPRKLTDCVLADCQFVGRYYFVNGLPADIYPVAKQLLTGAGFVLDMDTGPACDLRPSSAACLLGAYKGSDHIRVHIYNPGDDDGNVGIADPNRSLVVLLAERYGETR